jgi:hypothetical protein
MKKINISRKFYLLIVLALLVSGWAVRAAPQTLGVSIVIDGVKDAAWGDPLASDPVGDMSEPNLDLQGLYVVEWTCWICMSLRTRRITSSVSMPPPQIGQ